jgi:hypothetical protein
MVRRISSCPDVLFRQLISKLIYLCCGLFAITTQPSYHSRFNEELAGAQEVCSCAICPIKTDLRGPAPAIPPGKCLLEFHATDSSLFIKPINFIQTKKISSTKLYNFFEQMLCFVILMFEDRLTGH